MMPTAPRNFRNAITEFAARLLLATLILWPASGLAQTPSLDLPVNCTPGRDCWLVNLVDRAPGPERRDFACGVATYDGHRGTDFAVATLADVRRGVQVRAAASGIVTGTRDGMGATTAITPTDAFRGRECGNGVMIDHGGGWQTQYCHMKAGSVGVRKGQRIERGQRLGEIGLSGQTEFPHLHFTVFQNKAVIDPFTGQSMIDRCDPAATTKGLWSDPARAALAYPGPQPFNLGFAPEKPNINDVRAGKMTATVFPASAPALVFWADNYTLIPGDRVRVALLGPDGGIIEDFHEVIKKPFARRFFALGRKRRGPTWAPGIYTGVIEIHRGDNMVRRTIEARLEGP